MTAVETEAPDLLGADLAEDTAAAGLALARRYAADATLWVVSPGRESHADHIAARFAHPVEAGTRTLPATALTGTNPVSSARLAVRPGDVLLAVAPAGDDPVRDLMRRAPAWGATTIWIGFGPLPPAGAADHVLWLDRDEQPGTSARPTADRVTAITQRLWELTRTYLEHPDRLAPSTEPECTDEVCVTCRDEGRLGEVIAAPNGAFAPARVRTADGEEEVDVSLVGDVEPDDLLVVHAGMALTRLKDPMGEPQ